MKRNFVRSMLMVVAAAGSVTAQDTKPKMMPYTSVDNPQFVRAAEATFLSDSDVLIGVSHGDVAKAYPAADVGQHGAILDNLGDGPIAVTW